MENNTNYGSGALQNNTSGTNNTSIGAYSAFNNLDASNNTAIGSNSAYYTTSGSNNTSLGAGSLCNNTTGSLNTAIGSSALEGVLPVGSVGNQNTAVGAQSLYTNQGNQNTAIGIYAGLGVTGGNYNTFLGANSSTLNNASYDNSTAIGYNAMINGSNEIMLGGLNSGIYPNVVIPGLANYTTYNAGSYDSDTLVPKQYVDQFVSGITIKEAVTAIQIGSNIGGTYVPSGVGSITGVSSPLIIDSQQILDGSSVLLNSQTDPVQNGVYLWTPGTTTLTRRSGMQNGESAKSAYVFVKQGTINAKTAWVESSDPSNQAIVGVNDLNFINFSSFDYDLGRGLSADNTGGLTTINVDTSLNFINFLDSNSSVSGANGRLSIGTATTSEIILGPTGGIPIKTQSIIQAQEGVTGATGSFSYLSSSNNTYLATTSGRVGIGTSNPSYTLDVSGNINVTGAMTFQGGMSYNNTTDTLTATNFTGTVTRASIANSNANSTFFPVFVAGNGSQALLVDSVTGPFRLNPFSGDMRLANTIKLDGNRVAFGIDAGLTTQGTSTVAIGNTAGTTNQGNNCVAIGLAAGNSNQVGGATAVGTSAGTTSQGQNAVAVGIAAGTTSQGLAAVAVGQNAGDTSQGGNAVGIGVQAGQNNQGSGAVAVGPAAARGTAGVGQGVNAVAIGNSSGQLVQGASSVAVGVQSGQNNQGTNAVAIGNKAGQGTAGVGQGASSVAVGNSAGQLVQGINCVAVGVLAGQNNQGSSSIAIGDQAGQGTTSGLGTNSIAIGTLAGHVSQVANSICLNASGVDVNPAVAGLHINPVRNVTQTNVLGYNTTSKEITYYTPSAPTLEAVLQAGNTAGSNIDMSGNNITKVSSITNTGNITIEPSNTLIVDGTLDVSGNAIISGTLSGATGSFSYLRVGNIDITGLTGPTGSTGLTGPTGSGLWLENSPNNIYYSSGNVGIGTAIPSYTLDVSGNINVTKLIISNGGITGGTGSFSNLSASDITKITNTTNSTATNNGALVVSGGVGINKDIYCGGDIYCNGIVSSSNTCPNQEFHYDSFSNSTQEYSNTINLTGGFNTTNYAVFSSVYTSVPNGTSGGTFDKFRTSEYMHQIIIYDITVNSFSYAFYRDGTGDNINVSVCFWVVYSSKYNYTK